MECVHERTPGWDNDAFEVDNLELDSDPETKGSGWSMAYGFCVAEPARYAYVRQQDQEVGQ